SEYYRKSDAVLQLDSDTWSELYLSTVDLKGAIDSGKVKLAKGDAGKTTEAFDMFDRYKPGKNYKVPPYHH
ncbi:hypothetical protein C6A37_10670, partial [Desulfobacteraceae bacterium SEEP-SAG9]